MNQMEKDFIRKLTRITEENLANEHFGPEELASQVGMSHSGLHRKLKSIQNLSISLFIRNIRLEAAQKLLLSGELTVSEIARLDLEVLLISINVFMSNSVFHRVNTKNLMQKKILRLNRKIYLSKKEI